MKILHICLYGIVTDNWSYQDNLLPKYHKKIGYDVSVICSKYILNDKAEIAIDNRSEYLNEFGIKTIRLKSKYNITIKSKIRFYDGLYENICTEKPDIIFVHGVQFIDIKYVIRYKKNFPHVKIYVDNHADFSNSATNWISKNIQHKILWRHYAKKIEPYTEKFYGVLPARVDFLINIYGTPKEKTELLVMGADDEEVERALSQKDVKSLRSKHNISDDDFLIITGGKIDAAKKQTLLLMQAINQIENQRLKLLVFGSIADELKDELHGLCSEKVQYIGWIKSNEAYDYFAASDLAVFMGGHSVLWEQAVGTGIPLIVKYRNGLNHIDMGGNLMFLYKCTVEEIKNSIKKIVNDEELYGEMKKISVEKGIKKFSYVDIAKKSIEK